MSQSDREKRPIYMRRIKYGCLAPSSEQDEEIIEALPEGVDIEVSIAKRRSSPQLKLYWQMLNTVVKGTDDYPTSEHLHHAVKMHLGYTTPVRTFDGEIVHVADSVGFAKMDGFEFKEFFDRAVMLLATAYGIDPLEFYNEFEERVSKARKARSLKALRGSV